MSDVSGGCSVWLSSAEVRRVVFYERWLDNSPVQGQW